MLLKMTIKLPGNNERREGVRMCAINGDTIRPLSASIVSPRFVLQLVCYLSLPVDVLSLFVCLLEKSPYRVWSENGESKVYSCCLEKGKKSERAGERKKCTFIGCSGIEDCEKYGRNRDNGLFLPPSLAPSLSLDPVSDFFFSSLRTVTARTYRDKYE